MPAIASDSKAGLERPKLASCSWDLKINAWDMRTASSATSAPGRDLAYQLCANHKLRLHNGDVKAAFQQSRGARTGIMVAPVRELREAMDLQEEEVVMLSKKKKTYWQCDVPKTKSVDHLIGWPRRL